MGTERVLRNSWLEQQGLACLFYCALFLGADFDASLSKDVVVLLTEREHSQALDLDVTSPPQKNPPHNKTTSGNERKTLQVKHVQI